MTPKDRFSLCLFSSDAERKIKLTVCSDENKVGLANTVKKLLIMGSTNIEAGVDCGLSVLRDRRVRNNLTSVLLLTDGVDDYSKSIQ